MNLAPSNLYTANKYINKSGVMHVTAVEHQYLHSFNPFIRKISSLETQVFFMKSKFREILEVFKSSGCILIDCADKDIECWDCRETRIKAIVKEGLRDEQLVKD